MGLFSKSEQDRAGIAVNKVLRSKEDSLHRTDVKEDGSFKSHPLGNGKISAFGQMRRRADGNIDVTIFRDGGSK